MRNCPSLSRVTSIKGLSMSTRSSDKVKREVGESDTNTRGRRNTSSSAVFRNTKSVISKDGNQSVDSVSRLPMLTWTPRACEAMDSMSLFQSRTRGTIQKCKVSAAKATKPHAAKANHHRTRTHHA